MHFKWSDLLRTVDYRHWLLCGHSHRHPIQNWGNTSIVNVRHLSVWGWLSTDTILKCGHTHRHQIENWGPQPQRLWCLTMTVKWRDTHIRFKTVSRDCCVQTLAVVGGPSAGNREYRVRGRGSQKAGKIKNTLSISWIEGWIYVQYILAMLEKKNFIHIDLILKITEMSTL